MATLEYKKSITRENIGIIEEEYKIKIMDCKQLFIGFDKNTFIYKIEAESNKNYFLKIRTGIFNESSIIIPYILSQNIGKHIIEPIKTKNGNLYLKTLDYTIILYPFIFGKSGIEKDLSEKQWVEFGKLLYEIHNTQLPSDIKIISENFKLQWGIKLKKYIEIINEINVKDKYTKGFINLLISKKEIILKIILRTEELYNQIKKLNIEYCLCHGDIHAGNIFISEDNEFYIVDWDTLIFAPKERDLMFIGGGVANKWNKKTEEEYFYKGYSGKDNINKIIMAYYRYERIIVDIVEYYDQFFVKDIGWKNKKVITEVINSIFNKNNVVEIALLEN